MFRVSAIVSLDSCVQSAARVTAPPQSFVARIRRRSTSLVLLFLLTSFGCGRSPAPEKTKSVTSRDVPETGSPAPFAVPAVAESKFQNTGPNAHMVGGKRCADCHAEQAAAFFETRHAKSMSLPDSIVLSNAEVEHSKSGYRYQSASDGKSTTQFESMLIDGHEMSPAQFSVEYVLGSGRFGHSFLSQVEKFRVQSPLTWYATRKCWDMSPGYDFADQLSFRRVVSARCLYCHAGNVEVKNQNEFDFTVHETAISCERCHGPGSMHVEFRDPAKSKPDDSPIDDTIVNPSHLHRELSESICQQCHLQGDAQIPVRGQSFDSFRPGQPLTAFRQDYRLGSSSQMTIVGHVEQLHASPCYQKTETLTCITCHEPHHSMAEEQLPQHYRSACIQCHNEKSCTEAMDIRMAMSNDQCDKCHMPAAPTEVPHVAFTHHRIGIHKLLEKPAEKDSTTLHAVLSEANYSPADVSRTRGLAWLHIALSKPDVDFQEALKSAREQLTLAWEGGAGDATVAAGLATIAAEISWDEQAELWAKRTLELDSTPSDARMKALTIQSEQFFRRNDNEKAMTGLTEVTEFRRDARNWFFRGLVEQNLGNTDDSIRSLETSLTINPRNPGVHSALAAIYQLRKDDAKAEYHRSMLEKLMPKKR